MTDAAVRTPNIVLSLRARKMIKYAVQTMPGREVQGFGRIETDDDGDVWVKDIIIPPHVATGSSVELKPETLALLWEEIVKAGSEPSEWNFWWHSHGTGGVFASGEDTNTLRALAVEYDEGIAFGMVTNANGDYHGWYAAIAQTERFGRFAVEGKLSILTEVEPEDKKLKKLVDEMMKRVEAPAPPKPAVVGAGHTSPFGQMGAFMGTNTPSRRLPPTHGASVRTHQGIRRGW